MSGVLQILVSPRGRRLLASGLLALAAAGCGQKGPLFVPTGEAAAGRATLPEALNPGPGRAVVPSTAASSLPPTGTVNPVHNQ